MGGAAKTITRKMIAKPRMVQNSGRVVSGRREIDRTADHQTIPAAVTKPTKRNAAVPSTGFCASETSSRGASEAIAQSVATKRIPWTTIVRKPADLHRDVRIANGRPENRTVERRG